VKSILRPKNQGLAPVGSATKFEDFVESFYRTTSMPVMVKSSRDRYDRVEPEAITKAEFELVE